MTMDSIRDGTYEYKGIIPSLGDPKEHFLSRLAGTIYLYAGTIALTFSVGWGAYLIASGQGDQPMKPIDDVAFVGLCVGLGGTIFGLTFISDRFWKYSTLFLFIPALSGLSFLAHEDYSLMDAILITIYEYSFVAPGLFIHSYVLRAPYLVHPERRAAGREQEQMLKFQEYQKQVKELHQRLLETPDAVSNEEILGILLQPSGGASDCEAVATVGLWNIAPVLDARPELASELLHRPIAPLCAWGMDNPDTIIHWVTHQLDHDKHWKKLGSEGRRYLREVFPESRDLIYEGIRKYFFDIYGHGMSSEELRSDLENFGLLHILDDDYELPPPPPPLPKPGFKAKLKRLLKG